MEENQTSPAVNAGNDTSPVASPAPTNDQPNQVIENASETSQAPQDNDGSQDSSFKPTRLEKRIQEKESEQAKTTDLLQKLKSKRESGEEEDSFTESYPNAGNANNNFNLPWMPQSNPFDGKEEISPEELDAHITEKAGAIAELRVKQVLQATEYRDQVRGWHSDLEKLVGETPELDPDSDQYDPVLDAKLQKYVVMYNGDPSKGQFKPKVKASEIFSDLNDLRTAARTKGQVDGAKILEKQMNEGAVTPTSKVQNNTLSSEEIEKMKRENPGKLRKLLEKSLPKYEYN